MQINSVFNEATAPAKRKWKLGTKILVFVVAIGSLAVIGVSAISGNASIEAAKTFVKDRGFRALDARASLPKALVGAVPRIINSYFTTPDLPTIQIDIKFKHLKRLRDKRAEAFERGNLITTAADLVPATLTLGGKTVRIRMRLKGDWLDHLRGAKWSFRIEVRDGEEVLGMRRFSVQHPRTRGFQGETLFVSTLQKFDILAPRYLFANLVVNGKDLGIMAVEEHFSKELLESSGRKEGVILRFDESLFWASMVCRPGQQCFNSALYTPFNNYKNAYISPFRSTTVANSPKLSSDYRVAVGLLRGFVSGELAPSEAFDAERLGAFIAIAEVFSSRHSVTWNNQRFYLNPYTMKLEPVGFDGNLHSPDVKEVFREPIVVEMLRDATVYAAYRKTAQRLAEQIASGELIDELKKVESRYLPILKDEFFFLGPYDYRQLVIRARTGITDREYPILAHAYLIENEDGTSYLELTNASDKDVLVESVEWVGDDGMRPFETTRRRALPLMLPALKTPYAIPDLETLPQPQVERLPLKEQKASPTDRLQVTTSIPGTTIRKVTFAIAYHPPLTSTPMPRADLQEQLARHPFLETAGPGHVLKVKPGIWRVSGSIIVPKGCSLEIPAGTTLRFDQDAVLVAYGPVRFSGTPDAPIVLEGDTEAAGVTAGWQGVAVVEAGEPSEWAHVHVRNTTGVSQGAWQLTGGVNFYKSDIRLISSVFDGNRGEDALNIISAKFEMDAVTISNTASDGFDADFTTGVVRNSHFRDIGSLGGGDALDVSGSQVTVEASRFERISDKALSVGEQSTMRARNLAMFDVGAGVASKDNSHLDLADTGITGARVAALMAYIKKPEFGGAEIVAERVIIGESAAPAVAQVGSRISLNGDSIPAQNVDVDQLYETVMKPGARR